MCISVYVRKEIMAIIVALKRAPDKVLDRAVSTPTVDRA